MKQPIAQDTAMLARGPVERVPLKQRMKDRFIDETDDPDPDQQAGEQCPTARVRAASGLCRSGTHARRILGDRVAVGASRAAPRASELGSSLRDLVPNRGDSGRTNRRHESQRARADSSAPVSGTLASQAGPVRGHRRRQGPERLPPDTGLAAPRYGRVGVASTHRDGYPRRM